MPSKACETLNIQPYPISYVLLGSQENTITLAHPDEPYMQKCEDSGKHRFHGLEHDSKIRLFTTYSHTSTLRGDSARPTPLSLRFSRCPPGLLRQTYPRGPLRPHRRLQWHCRLRAASPLGRAEEQPLRPAPRSLPLTMFRELPLGYEVLRFLGPQGFRKYRKSWTTTRESRGGSSISPRLTTHSSAEKEAQMVRLKPLAVATAGD